MRQAEHREAFGTLRSVLEGRPDGEGWRQVCACLEVLSASEEFASVVVPYCRRAVAQRGEVWGGLVRRAPGAWQRALMAGEEVPAFALVGALDPTIAPTSFAQLIALWGSPYVQLRGEALAQASRASFEGVMAACGVPIRLFDWSLGAAPQPGDARAHEVMMSRLGALAGEHEPGGAARSSWADLDRALVGFLAQWLLVPLPEARPHRELLVRHWRAHVEALCDGSPERACFVAWPGQRRAALIWALGGEVRTIYAAPKLREG